MTVRSHFRLTFAIALTLALCDQTLKKLVVDYFQHGPSVVHITPFFDLILTWNRGVSFGLLHDAVGQWALIGVGVLITVALIQWIRQAENRLQVVSISLIIGGAVGNIIDRLHYGAVVDYLLFYIQDYHFPAFNIADAAISIGVIMYLYEHFTSHTSLSLRFLTRKR